MTLGQEPPKLIKHRLFFEGRKFNFEVSRFELPNKSIGDWEWIRLPLPQTDSLCWCVSIDLPCRADC